jgi:uncharacterized protein with von Willebrand factor type A (vWA) domain
MEVLMSLLDKAVERARALRSLFHRTDVAEVGTHTDAVKRDSIDEHTWENLLDDVPVLNDDIRDLGTKHDYVADFMEDMYNVLHQGDPKARDHKEVTPKHKANVDMAQKFLEQPGVMSLRKSTMHDDIASAMGLRSMKEEIRTAYETAEEARQQYQEAQDAEDAANQAAQQLSALLAKADNMQPGDPGADDLAGQIEAASQALQQATGISDQAAQAAQEAAEQAAQEAAQQVGKAAQQAKDDMDAEQAAAAAFGVEPGDLQRMDFDTRRQLAEKLAKVRDLAAFVAMIGQAKNVERGEFRKRITNNPDEISGVRLSNDMGHLTSGEYMALAIPELETDFWIRFGENRLVTYELSGTEKLGKGPTIFVVDESGSMAGPCEQWASALTLSAVDRCAREGRDFIYIGFSSAGQQFRKDFPAGRGTVEDRIDVVTHFFGGGTRYEQPLTMAADIVQEYATAGKDKPDIVFITDDAYTSISQEFMVRWDQVKAATQMRVFGILLGTGDSGALSQVSDNVRTLDDVSNLDGVRDIFRVL